METFALILTLSVITKTALGLRPLSDGEIFKFNHRINATWKAGNNFDNDSLNNMVNMFGANIGANREYTRRNAKEKQIKVDPNLPEHFDSRKKWPHCPSLNSIRDQGACFSSWAIGSVEAMSDRICIKGGGNVSLSTEDVLSCCQDCGSGCLGGYSLEAYQYYQTNGVVSGGLYGSNKTCYPYEIPPCNHHPQNKHKPCGHVAPTPRCKPKCLPGYGKTYQQDKHYGSAPYTMRMDVDEIKTELVTNGPITAAMLVYEDFMYYKKGVYYHAWGSGIGGQSVKIIGYGMENDVPYWLVANSWNPDWGDKGFFKILLGINECSIEDAIITAEPKLDNAP